MEDAHTPCSPAACCPLSWGVIFISSQLQAQSTNCWGRGWQYWDVPRCLAGRQLPEFLLDERGKLFLPLTSFLSQDEALAILQAVFPIFIVLGEPLKKCLVHW